MSDPIDQPCALCGERVTGDAADDHLHVIDVTVQDTGMQFAIETGDCLEILRGLPDASIDAIVTDPPYGLSEHKPAEVAACLAAWLAGEPYAPKGRGFMGRLWDAWVPGREVWREALRVLKPGGHAVIFAGSRTADLMGMALRLAGFEVRDSLQWLYGTGFPKSLDVSKAIDSGGGRPEDIRRMRQGDAYEPSGRGRVNYDHGAASAMNGDASAYTPATPEAAAWAGWGTALKPAHEPIVLCRKPLAGTVAANVLAHGTGALNVDGCRIAGPKPDTTRGAGGQHGSLSPIGAQGRIIDDGAGRWPANVVLDETAAAMLDEQSGTLRAGWFSGTHARGIGFSGTDRNESCGAPSRSTGDSGGASRFFYVAKASRAERDAGVTVEAQPQDPSRVEGRPGSDNPRNRGAAPRTNSHPTVKPIALMRWLVRLVTPPGGVVLDPFTGSGSTGCACALEGFDFLGIDLDPSYL